MYVRDHGSTGSDGAKRVPSSEPARKKRDSEVRENRKMGILQVTEIDYKKCDGNLSELILTQRRDAAFSLYSDQLFL